MFKRIITAALAAIMLAVPVLSVSAAVTDEESAGADASLSAVGAEAGEPVGADTDSSATGAGSLIYFDATGWKNFKTVFCYVWQRGGDPFFAWKAKSSTMSKVKDNLYSFDLSKLESSTTLSGGMKDGVDYCVIFTTDIGSQTYDTTIGKSCIGDTAKLTGKQLENPKDSEKKAYEAVWKTNSKSYGPHKAITSIGSIVGSVLCPNENGEEVIGDWLPTYYTSPYVDVKKVLPKYLKEFGVKNIENVYAYIYSKKGSTLSEDEYKEIRQLLEKAYAEAYPSEEKPTIPEKPRKPYRKSGASGGTPQSNGGAGGNNENSGYSGGTNRSGASADGQEDIILFVLGGVMIISAAVVFITRKRKSE